MKHNFQNLTIFFIFLASIEEADPLDDQLIKELYDNLKSNSSDEEENHRDGKVLNLQDILDTVNPFSTGKSQNQIPGQHLGQHSGQHPGQQTGQYPGQLPGQQPGKHPGQQLGQQLGQHPHQLPHPGQHKLGKLQHSEQILPGKSGQNLPGQSLVAVSIISNIKHFFKTFFTNLQMQIKQAEILLHTCLCIIFLYHYLCFIK